MYYILILLFSIASGAKENPTVAPLFNPDIFQVGVHWIWSYSDCSGNKQCQAPYLFETYEVVKKEGDSVTIEMSSSPKAYLKSLAHHKFVADLKACQIAGKNMARFRRWKIRFYSRSFDNKWQLVSNRHKADAFTEKFNCFRGNFRSRKRLLIDENPPHPVLQWVGFPLNSWYSMSPEVTRGVMLERTSRHYKIRLHNFAL